MFPVPRTPTHLYKTNEPRTKGTHADRKGNGKKEEGKHREKGTGCFRNDFPVVGFLCFDNPETRYYSKTLQIDLDEKFQFFFLHDSSLLSNFKVRFLRAIRVNSCRYNGVLGIEIKIVMFEDSRN